MSQFILRARRAAENSIVALLRRVERVGVERRRRYGTQFRTKYRFVVESTRVVATEFVDGSIRFDGVIHAVGPDEKSHQAGEIARSEADVEDGESDVVFRSVQVELFEHSRVEMGRRHVDFAGVNRLVGVGDRSAAFWYE